MYPLSFLLKINQECISNMKITSVNVIECKPNVMGKVICVRINTDCKDIYGYGEVGLSYGKAHHAGVGIARDFGEIIVGMDPLKLGAPAPPHLLGHGRRYRNQRRHERH